MSNPYDAFKPHECYWLEKVEILEAEDRKDFFWQMMMWRRVNEQGFEVIESRSYCYGKN